MKRVTTVLGVACRAHWRWKLFIGLFVSWTGGDEGWYAYRSPNTIADINFTIIRIPAFIKVQLHKSLQG
jgi:hypothetical protein